jgi:hypothetical protein
MGAALRVAGLDDESARMVERYAAIKPLAEAELADVLGTSTSP